MGDISTQSGVKWPIHVAESITVISCNLFRIFFGLHLGSQPLIASMPER